MELKMNTKLFGPNFKVEHFYEDDKVETNKMEEHCYHVGRTLHQNYSVAISDCDGLVSSVAFILFLISKLKFQPYAVFVC